MSISRELYWNIGHGVVLPMYLLVIAASLVMLWGFWQRFATGVRASRSTVLTVMTSVCAV